MQDFMNRNKSVLTKDYPTILFTYIYFCSNYLGNTGDSYIKLNEYIDYENDQHSRSSNSKKDVSLYTLVLRKNIENVIVSNLEDGELCFKSMQDRAINRSNEPKVCYKECLDFLNTIEKLKKMMNKGMKIRVRTLDILSNEDGKFSSEIVALSKNFLKNEKKVNAYFKNIEDSAYGFYNMIHLFMG